MDQAELGRRADEILAQLTTEEKIGLLHQWSPGVPRLGIAPFRTGTEALHGAAWLGPATVFPQAVGLGATWDPDLLRAVGAAVGAEVRALHRRDPAVSLNVWAPVVNLLRDPRWGRNEEGYAEDPLLTARLATAYCAGLRGSDPVFWRTAPLLKHFLAHNHETARDTTSAMVRARLLHEYELPPFHGPVRAGVAAGVMPAYSLVNGRPNHVSPLLGDALRGWADGGDLVVCSDAYAPSNLVDTEHYFAGHEESHAAALRAGVDSFTDQGADPSVTVARLTAALGQGLISVADVDRAARRLLLLRLRLGEFHPDLDPYRDGPAGIDPAGHAGLARRAARASVVLLKNDARLLPLDPAGLRLAVLGPFADTLRADWYSGTMPYQVTVAAGLREALGVAESAGAGGRGEARPGATVTVADGADRVLIGAAAPGQPDLGEFDVQHWGPGLPAADGLAPAADVITLRPVATGRYLTVRNDGSLSAGQDRPDGWVVRETFALEPAAPARAANPTYVGSAKAANPTYVGSAKAANPTYVGLGGAAEPGDGGIVLRSIATGCYLAVDDASGEVRACAPDAAAAQPFRWDVLRDGTAEAARLAAAAGCCVLVVGNDPLINGRENQDRATLALPPAQDRPDGWVVRETFALEPAAPARAANPTYVGSARAANPTYVGSARAANPTYVGSARAANPTYVGLDGAAEPGDGGIVLRSIATGCYLAVDDASGEVRACAPDAAAAQPFRWDVLRDGTAEAARLAAAAGCCVLVVGNDPLINGRENQDRATLALPPAQDRLIHAVHAACPRLVLVVMSSYPYALGWAADHVPAIVWTSHGGQETGRALADLLTGAAEPTGRLAQTWYAADEDLPGLLDYDIIKTRRTYLYFDGCPVYPFGHGLSYTTFGYSGLRLDPAEVGPDGTVTVSVQVTNTGDRAGTEVVQCYTGPVAPRRPRPRGALAGFTRLSLAPGQTGTVQLPVPVSALAYWDVAAGRMTVDPGDYLVKVGSSSAAIRQSGWLRVRGPAPPPRPVRGSWIRAADFDDYDGITLVDETRERGDAVTPAGPAPGWIQFQETDLGPGPATLTVRVAREEPAPATVALRAGAPAEQLGQVTVPATGGRYAYTDVSVRLRDLAAPGPTELYLILAGPVRLAAFRIDP